LESNSFNKRAVAIDALLSLRFSIIPCEDFALHVVPTGVLTPEETTLLFQHMVVEDENR
jgi:hypothetical protein